MGLWACPPWLGEEIPFPDGPSSPAPSLPHGDLSLSVWGGQTQHRAAAWAGGGVVHSPWLLPP